MRRCSSPAGAGSSVALALLRFRGGRKVAPQLARMEAEDLIAAIFPDQLARAENLVGEREIPDHPLVGQTIADCLNDAMDIAGLDGCCAASSRGAIGSSRATSPSPRRSRSRCLSPDPTPISTTRRWRSAGPRR